MIVNLDSIGRHVFDEMSHLTRSIIMDSRFGEIEMPQAVVTNCTKQLRSSIDQ